MTEAKATNLAGREEIIGRNYPVILERLLLLIVIIVFMLGYNAVGDWSGGGFVGKVTTWCIFPCLLLFTAEMLGRMIQAMNRD
ncbi:MAG TPA: hypothetical protein HA354_00845 [Candidatus Poseidoniaceae archaeon]|nr:hypothetical protein [Euryarchaeota archaeon]DAC60130.1 MAG TPA: hypothetical protein D7I07_00830 [Candidatus Poseidoniales archaeon]HII37027.1 hypothetical protein [Candidatus Poseidoniaceae archaeon]|tara:strand:- start:1261 stop:1509 length:249 start_codon:yes stop_codon:yes gene_type:complete